MKIAKMNLTSRVIMKILILFSLIILVSATNTTQNATTEKINIVNININSSFILDDEDIERIKEKFNYLLNLIIFLNNVTKAENTTTIPEVKPRHRQRHWDDYRRSGYINWKKNITKAFPRASETKIKKPSNTVQYQKAFKKNPTGHVFTENKVMEYISNLKKHSNDIHKIINSTLNENNPVVKKIVRRMNDYYSDEDVKKLHNLLKEFKRYLENEKDTSQLVKDLMNSGIFKKYNSLDVKSKADLKKDLSMFAEYVSLDNILKYLDENHGLSYSSLKRSIDKRLKVVKRPRKVNDEDNQLIVNNIEVVLEPEGSKIIY